MDFNGFRVFLFLRQELSEHSEHSEHSEQSEPLTSFF